jgi:hypothetical protein
MVNTNNDIFELSYEESVSFFKLVSLSFVLMNGDEVFVSRIMLLLAAVSARTLSK